MVKSGIRPVDVTKVLDQVKIALAVIDSNGNVLWRNKRFHSWFKDKGGNGVSDLFIEDEILKSIRKKRICHFEREVRENGNKRRYFNFSFAPLRGNKTDKNVDLLVIADDTTEKRKIKLEVGKLSKLNESIIKNSPVGIFTLDKQGYVTSINPALVRMAGSSEKKIIGMNWITAETSVRAGISKKLEEGLSGKAFVLNNIPYTSYTAGKNVFISVKGIPIRDENGEVTSLLCIVEDTTERKKIEERYHTLFESANDGIFVTDLKGTLLSLNRKMAQLLDESQQKLIEKSLFRFVKEGHVGKVEDIFLEVSKGSELEPFEIDLLTQKGNKFTGEVNLSVVKQADEINLIQGIVRDITERKQMEAQLMRESKLSTIGRLAFGLAHEINNPVGLISWYVEDLLQRLETCPARGNKDIQRVEKSLKVMQEQANRCLNVIQNVLDFARTTVTSYEKIDLIRAMKNALALVDSEAQRGGKKIIKKLEFPPIYTMGNESQMVQVFLNILNNALDALPDTGEIFVCTKSSGEEVAVKISDTGMGIPPENLDKIFDPFFTTKPKGTGLGLSICYGIIKRMGGRIEVSSRVGKGTTFTILIPRVRT